MKRVRLLQERREAQEEIIELSSDDEEECIVDGDKRKEWGEELSTSHPYSVNKQSKRQADMGAVAEGARRVFRAVRDKKEFAVEE